MLHKKCHRRIHFIACFIIIYLERFAPVWVDELIQAAKEFLQEPEENIRFVIFDELKVSNIVVIVGQGKKCKKGKKCKLNNFSQGRELILKNIKKYVKERDIGFFDVFNAYFS